MDEDDHRSSIEDAMSVYLSASSHDGSVTPLSTDWEDVGSKIFPATKELVDGVYMPHSRNQSTASSQTLTNEAARTDGQAQPRPSNVSESSYYTGLADILIASAPHLRHLAAVESEGSQPSGPVPPIKPTMTPISEQRHPGKPDVQLSRATRPFELDTKETDEQGSQPESTTAKDEDAAGDGFLTGIPLLLLIIGLSLVVFLISIDRTIITTAIPFITSEFKSTADIGWYGSSYLLTACAFQPVFGRVFTLFNTKWSYLLSMFIFEVGSIVSGFAPSSACLIIGRAIAGFGSAGILTGSFVIVATAVPLTVRPIYTAVVGLMFGVGATIGPLIGGVFTELVSWRWCFWINLPVGAVTIIVMVLVFHPRPRTGPKRTIVRRLVELDLIGNVILLGASVMLFLALEYTLTGAPWGSAKIIGLFAGAGVTAIVFVGWLWWKQGSALIPPAVARQRTVSASCFMAFFTYGALLIHTYFLPIWFQAILGFSAIQSGVAMIPYFVANALFSVFSGVFVSVVGYFAPPAIIGSAIGTVGCGIISLFYPGMSTAMWIGFEILASAGSGMSIQQGFTAVQTVLSPEDLPVGTAAVVASQSLGGAVFISVGNSVFQNRLRSLLEETHLPGVDVKAIISAGAIAFRKMVPTDELPALLQQYNSALHTVLLVAIPSGGLAFLACCFLDIITNGFNIPS